MPTHIYIAMRLGLLYLFRKKMHVIQVHIIIPENNRDLIMHLSDRVTISQWFHNNTKDALPENKESISIVSFIQFDF